MKADTIEQQLAKFCLTPNRALGQNFLADENAALRIAQAACRQDLPALEIGPGLGALTGALLGAAARVTAVELDAAMVGALRGMFGEEKRLNLIHQDFLKFDLDSYAREAGAYCVAGNLPYYITTPICMKLLRAQALPERMALMVQREAGERFFAPPCTRLYGPLAVLAQLYYECSVLFTLSPAQYYPQPEVESAVILLARREHAPHDPSLAHFLEAAFAMRRKTLTNNLRAAGFEREAVRAAFERCGIGENARAEQLAPAVFAALARTLHV